MRDAGCGMRDTGMRARETAIFAFRNKESNAPALAFASGPHHASRIPLAVHRLFSKRSVAQQRQKRFAVPGEFLRGRSIVTMN